MDEKNADDLLFVNLDVGTLAIIVLVVVTTCSMVTLFSLYCWHRSSSHTSLHCARCHLAIGVYGLPLPPQSAPPVHPYSLVPNVPPISYQFQPPPHTTLTLSAKPAQHNYQSQNLPAIVVNQPDNVQCGDSATFQRLGMRRPDSGMGTDARTLETRALSQVQASPPEVTTPGLEPLTPSPVLSGNHQEERRRGRRVKPAEDHPGVSYEKSWPEPSKLQQVRIVNFPSFQTPCAKTPSNAVKPKRSSLKSSHQGHRSVSTLQPSQLFLAGHDKLSDQPLLDVSEMCRTAITTGDLKDLCENTAEAETSFTNPYQVTPATVSPGAALTPSPGVTLTPAAAITPASCNLSTPAPQSPFINPSPLTSLNSTLTPTLTPNNQYLSSQLEQYQLTQQPAQCVTDRRTDPSPHLAIAECEYRVNTRNKMSPNIVMDDQDAKVVDRRSLSSPHLAITDYEKNVTDRRSLAGGGTAPLPITSSDMFVTMRKEQYNTSPGNVFMFNKNFDPAQPHQETVHGQYHHHPLSDMAVTDPRIHSISQGTSLNNSTYKRKPYHPPSKIPINEGYLEMNGGSLKKTKALYSVVQSGDKQSPQNQAGNLDKSVGKVTLPKPTRPELDRSVGKATPKPQPPVLDDCSGGSGRKQKCATPGQDKSVTSSGTKLKSLPPTYPERPSSERKPAGNTKTKSPNI